MPNIDILMRVYLPMSFGPVGHKVSAPFLGISGLGILIPHLEHVYLCIWLSGGGLMENAWSGFCFLSGCFFFDLDCFSIWLRSISNSLYSSGFINLNLAKRSLGFTFHSLFFSLNSGSILYRLLVFYRSILPLLGCW